VGVLLSGLVGLVLLASGCQVSTDDELAPAPTRTVTATPSPSLAPAPATVPVGDGAVSPADIVWAQGSVLHVGQQQVDLAPIDVDAFVVVQGGVFVLADGELWFTDLRRVRGTASTEVTQVRISGDAARLAVTDTRSGHPLVQGYDTKTGKAIRGEVDTLTPQQLRAGPGRFEVHTGAGGTTVVDSGTGREVRVAGLSSTFELGAWSGDSAFYGVAGTGAKRSVVGCDLVRHVCTTKGRVTGSEPLVFGIGK
jgi:hypothetical protein